MSWLLQLTFQLCCVDWDRMSRVFSLILEYVGLEECFIVLEAYIWQNGNNIHRSNSFAALETLLVYIQFYDL